MVSVCVRGVTMRTSGRVNSTAPSASQRRTDDGQALGEPVCAELPATVPPAPVSGEILAPDGTIPLHQPPARLKLYRDDAATPADVITLPRPTLSAVPTSPPAISRQVATLAAAALIVPNRTAHRASGALSSSMFAGLALAVGLACVDETAFAPVSSESASSEVKTYTMRVAALPSLVLQPQALTASHHVMAVTAPVSTLLPMLADSAQFLRTSAALSAQHHHATPSRDVATIKTTLAASTTFAASGAVLGSLAAPVVAPNIRQSHHIGTSLTATHAVTAPATPIGVMAVPRPDTATPGKRNVSVPSPVVPAVKRVAPTKEAFARIDAATRTSLGARPAVTARSSQTGGGDWRSTLGSQQ